MGYVNIGGMHMIHHPKDTTALHEFDYDNQVGYQISKRKNLEEKKMQTTLYTVDGELVLKRKFKKTNKEKLKEKKEKREEIKKNATILVKKSKKKEIEIVEILEEVKKLEFETEKNKKDKKIGKVSVNNKSKLKEGALGNDPKFKALFESLLNEMNC